MYGQQLVLRTKLMPPRTRRWTLVRPRLFERLDLARDYRLTLLEAPTGYGKTTALAGWLAAHQSPYAWYSLGTVESDPLILLLHIIYAFRTRFPTAGHAALELLQGEPEPGLALINPAMRLLVNDLCDLLTEETFLAIDDFHLLDGRTEAQALIEEFISAAPPFLHLIIASRSRPGMPGLSRWQARNELLLITKDDLAFLPAETEELFREHYSLELSPEQAALLTNETEGWVIALQMYWQSAQAQPDREFLRLDRLPASLPGLFEYLAQEVLNRQTPATQDFLLRTAVLRRLRGDACAALLGLAVPECEARLQVISDSGLFLIPSSGDNSYRYHHLFGEFLHNRLTWKDPTLARQMQQKAARFFIEQNRPEDALQHILAAGDFESARDLLVNGLSENLLATGRMDRLEEIFTAFPAEILETAPALLISLGDCYRLTSRFDQALATYVKAAGLSQQTGDRVAQARALRGSALIYVDTVQPAQAEALLEEALALVNTTEERNLKAALLRDLAENKINRGRSLEAEGLFRQAHVLLGLPETGYEDVRIFLRTGRLNEAAEILQQGLENERPDKIARAGRNHREALLLLSLINSLQGNSSPAVAQAEQGIKLAQDLRTPFTEAVAWQRLGHALTVAGRTAEAAEAYLHGTTMGDRLHVRRLRAEGFMGLCALEGRPGGSLEAARHAAAEGLEIARQAGDEWIEGFITLCLAGALIQHGPAYALEGREVLQTARQLFENCGERFGLAVVMLWQALLEPGRENIESLLAECRTGGYLFLVEKPTFFGPKEPARLAHLHEKLRTIRSTPPAPAPHLNPARLTGQPLTVLSLGTFLVRRADGTELTNRDWQREKARQLFQLLLTLRYNPLPREHILELLWPESEFSAAEAGFKVALNALSRALEPDRPSRSQSSFIIKEGGGQSLAYSLNLDPDLCRCDALEFQELIRKGRLVEAPGAAANPAGPGLHRLSPVALAYYNQAIALYRGDYLPACLYEDWAAPERERLLSLFLTTAERLAQAMAAEEQWERCLELCRLILNRDNCWEEAYRLSMLAYYRHGNRTAALRTFERCGQALKTELDLAPLPQTAALYDKILND
jgi:LuxR family maltose regulon positive regulatory protein